MSEGTGKAKTEGEGNRGPGQRRQLREVKAGRQAEVRQRVEETHSTGSHLTSWWELRKCLRKRDNHTDKDGQERG